LPTPLFLLGFDLSLPVGLRARLQERQCFAQLVVQAPPLAVGREQLVVAETKLQPPGRHPVAAADAVPGGKLCLA